MNTVSVIMVIWTGYGASQTLAVEQFDTIESCEAAKTAIVEHYKGFMRQLSLEDVACITPVPQEVAAKND